MSKTAPALAVRELERAILTGRRGEAEQEPGVVTPQDVETLRALCPAADELDRATAEALFDIAHATATARNDPAFAGLFADLLDGYVKAAPGGLGVCPGEATPPYADQLDDIRYAEARVAVEARIAAATQAGPAHWALRFLARGGALSAAEAALVARLRRDALDRAA